MIVNRGGYLVSYRHDQDGLRTYACSDRGGLDALILHLTGRDAATYPQDTRGLPTGFDSKLVIAHPVHIWGHGQRTGETQVDTHECDPNKGCGVPAK